MVSVYPTPPAAHQQDFYYFPGMGDPMKVGLPGLHSLQPPTNVTGTTGTGNVIDSGTGVVSEDPNKKVRKPYTITKSRESWTDQEHDKFLEALQLFDRDWKKIEAFVGSKTVIQIRSHAQKYFLKVQKSGTSEHVPPPRPKRKASHPYPQKAPKTAGPQVTGQLHSSSALVEPKYVMRPDSLSVPGNSVSNPVVSPWTYNTVPTANTLYLTKDKDMGLAGATITHNYSSSSNESTPRIWPINETSDQVKEKDNKPARVMPDFAQVYSFIGSIFDPNASDHLLRLRKMDPINMETVLMLMKNLSVNLVSPEFEDHRRLIASSGRGTEEYKQKAPNKMIPA
ncbi:protein REVEILLE 3 isoform X1 [Coffea eugenioides]|uniref:protein REVEILLE 3 isoform X1 n=1 Tax=Coffea eugenioides TaxID=49369 RepID=UPI000F605EAE|nr:protein REVEILLE 3 isoform X1 [Coffea eugenioides]XP_027160427.1 protein REVEILLE 3 isoform X1 [Coffea eugenioides]XP_027160428.1 protein REVEILLE 3 isoform X1 [Coffea eugenioides]